MYPFISSEMSNKEYHSRPEISKSGLDKIARSVEHYHSYKLFPPEKKSPSPSLVLGSLYHLVVLQPHLLHEEFAIMPSGIDKRTTKGKDAYAEFEKSALNKTIITIEQLEQAQAMAEAVHKRSTAQGLLLNAKFEQSAFWVDPDINVACRCRPDIAWPTHLLADLKSTEDAGYEAFKFSIKKYAYSKQAAFYLDGYSAATGEKFETFVFVASEKTEPYSVSFYTLTNDIIEHGRKMYKQDLIRYREYLETGIVKSYLDEIQIMDYKIWSD